MFTCSVDGGGSLISVWAGLYGHPLLIASFHSVLGSWLLCSSLVYGFQGNELCYIPIELSHQGELQLLLVLGRGLLSPPPSAGLLDLDLINPPRSGASSTTPFRSAHMAESF